MKSKQSFKAEIPLKLLEKHADCRSGYPQISGKICRMNQLFL